MAASGRDEPNIWDARFHPANSAQGPRQAAIVQNILKSRGVEDYEPRVTLQLIEFMQRM